MDRLEKATQNSLVARKLTISDKTELNLWTNNQKDKMQDEGYARFVKYGLIEDFNDMWSLCHLYAPFDESDENLSSDYQLSDSDQEEIARIITKFYKATSQNVRLAFCHQDSPEILGVAMLEFVDDKEDDEKYALVHRLIVNPNYLHKGIGSAMLNHLKENINKYSQIKAESILYMVDKDNLPCLNMLDKCDFSLSNKEHWGGSQYIQYKFDIKEKENEI